jgi:type II secretory pathway pseudopilin PulG
MVLDVIMGIILLAFLSTVLIVAQAAQSKGAIRLEQARTAHRAADATVLDLQSGAALTQWPDVEIRVDELPTAAPAGSRWVRVITTCERGRAELVAVVPSKSPGGGQ